MAKSVKPTPERKQELDAIRKWATENGIECPSRGRIPQSVREAYEAAVFVHAYAEDKNGNTESKGRGLAHLAAIRDWARENGMEVSTHGRIPQRIVAAYQEAWGAPQEQPKRRLVVRFDPKTLSFWPENVTYKRETNKLRATVIHYVENTGARAPGSGKFTSQRFTVNIDGEKWVGQVKNGTDVVRLRPYEEAYSDARV
jgi:hypothetical protein